MAHPLPSNSDESELIFSKLTEDSGYPILITFIVAIIIYGAISNGISSIEKINLVSGKCDHTMS